MKNIIEKTLEQYLKETNKEMQLAKKGYNVSSEEYLQGRIDTLEQVIKITKKKMEKQITINIPEAKEIKQEVDKDGNITIKFVDKVITRSKSWEEYCKMMEGKKSYYIALPEFDNKEDAEAFTAYSKLIKLRKNWIGEWKPNWANESQRKYVIFNYAGEVVRDISLSTAHCLSFPTLEMREEFFNCFKDYLEQAKDLI